MFVLVAAAVLFCSPSAWAACEGDSCPQEHAAARAAGLLGATACTPKQYPLSGSKVTPFNLSAPLLDVRWGGWDHERDRYLFAITSPSEQSRGGDVWRSEDYGKTWNDITDQLAGATRDESAFGITGLEGIVDIQFHPDDVKHMLFHGLGFHHWITEDSGRSFKAVDTPGGTLGFWSELRLHPNQTEWILARTKRNECLQYEQDLRTNPWCAHDLFLSQDFGKNWRNLTKASKGGIASFWDFDWGAHMHTNGKTPYKPETILATAYEDPKHMKGLGVGWDEQIHFIQSDDFFASAHDKLASCGNQFEIAAHKLFLAMPAACPSNPDGSKRKVTASEEIKHVKLFQSNDAGQEFEQVCLPVRDLDLGYSLVSTHDREGIYMLVDHDEEDVTAHDAPINNVYAPGRNNPLYTSSLPRNFKRQGVEGALTDFARVEGMPGVLLGNQLEAGILEQYAQSYRHPNYEEYIQTKITFNGGSTWRNLQAPARYTYPKCNRCAPGDQNCQLHLHGPSSWYAGPGGRPSFYTHESAPGLIMAVGNTGAHLDLTADQQCTWLSRDGGLSWEDVREDAHIYEFGDHGGIIMSARHGTQGPADSVQISLDEGRCWHTIPLAEAMSVDNIRVEPRGASHVFVVHGSACQRDDRHPTCTHTAGYSMPAGKMYVLDMRTILGSDFRTCEEADYEQWHMLTPADGSPRQCLLGRDITQKRQRQDADCFNGKDWEWEDQKVTKCQCSMDDVECEFGYERVNSTCVAMQGVRFDDCPALAGKAYKPSSTNLRQVQGDVCTDLSKVITDTDGNGNYSGGPAARRSFWRRLLYAVAAIAGVAAVAGAAVVVVRSGGEGLRSRFEDIAAPALGFVGSCYDWAREKVTGRGAWRQAQEAYFEPLPDTELGLEDVDGRSPPLRQM